MLTPNFAFEEELFYKYLRDAESVSPEWRAYFKRKGSDFSAKEEKKAPASEEKLSLSESDELQSLSPMLSRVASNMEESIEIPTATSFRDIPVKALDENRRIINKYLQKLKRRRISFTHLLAWAIVKGLIKYPLLNSAFTKIDGKAHRILHKSINIGLAVDIARSDGSRMLLVPNIKNAQNLNFSDFIEEYDRLIDKARNNKISPDDMFGTTVTLTNPGMIGTTCSSPRLMKGQGLIVASGSIDYPVEFQAVRPDLLTTLAVSKVLTITNTYDHRIIQGAESAEFLAYLSKLLLGADLFYDQIFAILRIPFEPIRWSSDIASSKNKLYDEQAAIEKGAHVMLMINAYRVRGHLLANINPLGFESYYYPELDPAHYGFTIWDLDRYFHADDSWDQNDLPLRQIIEILRETYCGTTGYEFMYIQNPEKKEWIKSKLELKENAHSFSKEEKTSFLKKLIEAEEFENFLHTKFIGSKRFSLEGSESMIVMLDKLFQLVTDNDLSAISLGMAHRGRLNVLANIIGKDLQTMFAEFDGVIDAVNYFGSGDVKYHLGADAIYSSENGKEIQVVLSPNPSHLELVNPVVEGVARALDNKYEDPTYTKTLPILIHGDAAFSGQGIVAETLNLSELEGYRTGGTIHIIINNQIGFTTTAIDARSTVYSTDIAKMIQVPILHVNGHSIESVVSAAIFAFEYRKKFNNDLIIDLLCYRKYGHNEADEPSYTQPLLYKKIKNIAPVSKIFSEEILKEGVIEKDFYQNYIHSFQEKLTEIFNSRKAKEIDFEALYKKNVDFDYKSETAVEEPILKKIAEKISYLPERINAHSKVKQLFSRRATMLDSPLPAIDWGMAELLAFGSILLDGREIRFSGEDSRRGTFSHRHAVVVDIKNENIYIPLNNIEEKQGLLRIFDSPLSELSILGFEYGYSTISKNGLTIWEAQFGDFANMAQPIIDQYIVCGEVKWGISSNLVLLLPHSYEGQGAEHSSARLERFLQLCADNNIIVANLSTPAQYFHILRRQLLLEKKKPLVIMSPKSILRHQLAVSSLNDFTQKSFKTIMDDERISDYKKVKKLIFCSGKIYYDLLQAKENGENIAIIRIEQLYPFDEKSLKEILKKYTKIKEYLWLQEEPQNQGAWNFINPILSDLLNAKIKYIGRKQSPSTATGSFIVHNFEQEQIIKEALTI